MKGFIILMIFVCSVLLLTTCSPRISEIRLQKNFQRKDFRSEEFVVDSTTSLTIVVNTYKGLFKGRESFFYFGEDLYRLRFNKIDTIFRETDINYFWINRYNNSYHKEQLKPQYCVLKIKETGRKKIEIDFEIQDTSFPEILKGKYKLRFNNYPYHLETYYKFYEKRCFIFNSSKLRTKVVDSHNENVQISDTVKVQPQSNHLLLEKLNVDPRINWKPIIIVDGEETNDLKSISPEEIESITILKEQSAIELYGEKAKNGAVIIITKSDNVVKTVNE